MNEVARRIELQGMLEMNINTNFSETFFIIIILHLSIF